MNWIEKLRLVWPLISAIMAAILGSQFQEARFSESMSAPQSLGIGFLTFGTGITLFMSIISNWRKAGGKLDGKLTPEEFNAVAGTLLPKHAETIEKISPQAAMLVDLLGKYVSQMVANGKPLNVFSNKEAASDHNHRSLIWSLVDSLALTLQGDKEGEDAVAVIRTRLDELLFPATKNTPTT